MREDHIKLNLSLLFGRVTLDPACLVRANMPPACRTHRRARVVYCPCAVRCVCVGGGGGGGTGGVYVDRPGEPPGSPPLFIKLHILSGAPPDAASASVLTTTHPPFCSFTYIKYRQHYHFPRPNTRSFRIFLPSLFSTA